MSVRMPSLNIPHGAGSCIFMDWNLPCLWGDQAFTVHADQKPGRFYDYHGFPPHAHELTDPVPGAPALAMPVVNLLQEGMRR